MISPFNDMSDLKARQLINGATDLIRLAPGLFFSKIMAYLFPLAFFICAAENIYEGITAENMFSSVEYLVNSYDAETEARALFNMDFVLLLLFIKNLLQGVFYGVAAWLISQILIPRFMKQEINKQQTESTASRQLEEKQDRIGLLPFLGYSVVIYLPLAIILFLVELYNLHASQNPSLAAMGQGLNLLFILLFIVYIPFAASFYPWLSEKAYSFKKALNKAWSIFRNNYFQMAGGILTGYLIIFFLSFAVQGLSVLIQFIITDILGMYQAFETVSDTLFWINALTVLLQSLILIITAVIPLIGYTYYALYISTENKQNADTAFASLMDRLNAKLKKKEGLA